MHLSVGWPWWLGFHLVVGVLLAIDLLKRGRGESSRSFAWFWTGFLALLSLCFALLIGLRMGSQSGMEYLAGYAVESSLSLDNLFVFLVIFRAFGLDEPCQHRALGWGIGGALLLRAGFIAGGIALLEHFAWVNWIFALLLLVAAMGLLRQHGSGGEPPRFLAPLLKRPGHSILLAIVAVELADVLFALDSIPAVLGLSHTPFIVYTSNVAAIVGLRSLYFVLADSLTRFRLLHQALGLLLGFVALKMLLSHWIEIPILASLGVMALILLGAAAGSWWLDQREAHSR